MNYLKKFLKELTKNKNYRIETIDNVAEIYVKDEQRPAVMLEFNGEVYYLNFRCDLLSSISAQITYDMTMIDADIVIGPDFFYCPDAGLLYGEEALVSYFSFLIESFENAKKQQEAELSGVLYVVEQPIETTYGFKNDRKNKM